MGVTTDTAITATTIGITTTTIIIVTGLGLPLSTVAPATTATIETSPLSEIALVLVRLDHVASFIANWNDGCRGDRLRCFVVSDCTFARLIRMFLTAKTDDL